MKKIKIITSITLCVILAFSLCIPAFAATNELCDLSANVLTPTVSKEDYLYEELFLNKYEYEISSLDNLMRYHESYHNKNENGDVDFAIVYAFINPVSPAMIYGVFADRVIVHREILPVFSLGYGAYVAEDDTFYAIQDFYNKGTHPEIREAFENLNAGYLIGDADMDDEITIMDATKIQRCLVELDSFYSEDKINDYFCATREKIGYISDFDRDGERTIMDATAIQRKLAKL